MKKHDILVVGHYSHDILILKDGKKKYVLGGPPSYISSILVPLAIDFDVVSKVGRDFKYWRKLKELGIKRKPILTDKPTTTFLHDYSKNSRESKVLGICEPIYPDDIKTKQKVAIIAGHICEVLPETIERLKETSDFVLADIQTFIRRVGPNKSVYHVDLRDTLYYRVLEKIDFLKTGVDEAKFIDIEDVAEKTNILITEGEKGCTIYTKGTRLKIPSRKVKVVDSTGAGDVFLGGFAYGLLKGYDIQRCGEIANSCAALAVTQVGVPKLTRRDVEKFL